MARLMMFEAITKAVVAGANYREMVLCDNFYTPRVRPETAFELVEMVETIASLSVELGVPFISGKDSSSGTFEAGGKRIDVPPTLAVATMGRVNDVKAIVTKDFKRAGNRLLLLGRYDADVLGGTVYADSLGQRGDRLFDAYDAISMKVQWDYLLELHAQRRYVSASAIAEGGILLRLFEAAFGSGLGRASGFRRHPGRAARRLPFRRVHWGVLARSAAGLRNSCALGRNSASVYRPRHRRASLDAGGP